MTDRSGNIAESRLTLGPLQIVIQSDYLELHQQVRSAYDGFTRIQAPAPYTLAASITVQPGTAPVDYLFPLSYQDRVLHFASSAYSGHIDLSARRASCVLTTPQVMRGLTNFLCASLALLAFEAGGLFFHGAGVLRHGRAYLFFGPSGAGKTTASRVSRDAAGATVLNDDLVILLPQADRWLVQSTPFTNPTQVPPAGDMSGPLHAIYRLAHSPRVYTEPIVPALAVAELLTSCPIVSADPERADQLLARLERLVHTVPVQRLHLRPDASFWANLDAG